MGGSVRMHGDAWRKGGAWGPYASYFLIIMLITVQLMDYLLSQQATDSEQHAHAGMTISPYASVCLLRGRALEALENRRRAVEWYRAALAKDPYCFEAFRWGGVRMGRYTVCSVC